MSSEEQIISMPPSKPHDRGSEEFVAVMPPVHRASTVYFKNCGELSKRHWRERSKFAYGRDGSPTTRKLEASLAEIEGAVDSLITPSGLSGFALICFALLEAGDTIALPTNGYATAASLASTQLVRFGLRTVFYEPMDPESWTCSIPESTKLLWIEAPGSVTLEMPDIHRLVNHGRSRGAYIGMDNTWSAGIHFKPFPVGIDVSLQALTKFQSGGGDVVLGSVSSCDEILFSQLHESRHLLGLSSSPDDAYLVLRNLPTLSLRYERSFRSAQLIASWFTRKERFGSTLAPFLESCAGHSEWKKHFTSAAGLFSFAWRDCVSPETIVRFVDSLSLFKIGYSWGGPSSLALPYMSDHPAMRRLHDRGLRYSGAVRFWIGLEDPILLIDDLERAWQATFSET
jgi:cysteine-S-conjugate beta-lyase